MPWKVLLWALIHDAVISLVVYLLSLRRCFKAYRKSCPKKLTPPLTQPNPKEEKYDRID